MEGILHLVCINDKILKFNLQTSNFGLKFYICDKNLEIVGILLYHHPLCYKL